jgi:hypothetical protein
MESALARVVGPRGVAAMLARSRELCGEEANERAALRRLSHDLLGAVLAQRLLQPPGTSRV